MPNLSLQSIYHIGGSIRATEKRYRRRQMKEGSGLWERDAENGNVVIEQLFNFSF